MRSPPNPDSATVVENRRPGDADWWKTDAPQHSIEGYARQVGLRPGDTLELSVSTTPSARYRIDVYRLGWYDGAGARRVATHASCQGTPREAPEPDSDTGLCAAGWPVTDRMPIERDWVSGMYIARLELTTGRYAGRMAFVAFVVRPRLDERPTILVQAGVNTAQAYNHWGGRSLYSSNSRVGIPAVKVSLQRPYNAWQWANLNSRWPFGWDYQLVRFLERHGYDVGYTTDVDTHREPWSLIGHPLLMTAGHDEYWTSEMFDALEAALVSGSNLACMGANTIYWQTRYEDSEQTLVQYRDAKLDPDPDPARKTVRFRDLRPSRPERRILGVEYDEGLAARDDPRRDFEVTEEALSDRWFARTGFAAGDRLHGLVGYEWDGLPSDGRRAEGLRVFFHHEGTKANADTVRWRLECGALVFAAGSIQFAWGLDDWGCAGHVDPRLQRFMHNALAELQQPSHAPSTGL